MNAHVVVSLCFTDIHTLASTKGCLIFLVTHSLTWTHWPALSAQQTPIKLSMLLRSASVNVHWLFLNGTFQCFRSVTSIKQTRTSPDTHWLFCWTMLATVWHIALWFLFILTEVLWSTNANIMIHEYSEHFGLDVSLDVVCCQRV